MSKTGNRQVRDSRGEAGKGRPRVDRGVLGRVFGMLLRAYPVLVPVAAFCIIFNAVCSVMPAVFQQRAESRDVQNARRRIGQTSAVLHAVVHSVILGKRVEAYPESVSLVES